MNNERDHITTFIRIKGTSDHDMKILANLAPPIDEPEAIWSVMGNLSLEGGELKYRECYEVASWLTAFDRGPNGDVFAVSMDGEIHHQTKGKWSVRDLGCSEGFIDVWVADEHSVFAVGEAGWIAAIARSKERIEQEGGKRCLYAVHGSSSGNVYAVGDEGTIVHFDGRKWTVLDSPTNVTLNAVCCCSPKEVYIGGGNGGAFKGAGSSWVQLECPTNIDVTSLAWHRGRLYAAAGDEGVYMLKGNSLEKIKQLAVDELQSVGAKLFCLGGEDIYMFDGVGWYRYELEI